MVLQPGESTKVKSNVFSMPEGMGGPHNFAIHLETNDPNRPKVTVNVLSNWVP